MEDAVAGGAAAAAEEEVPSFAREAIEAAAFRLPWPPLVLRASLLANRASLGLAGVVAFGCACCLCCCCACCCACCLCCCCACCCPDVILLPGDVGVVVVEGGLRGSASGSSCCDVEGAESRWRGDDPEMEPLGKLSSLSKGSPDEGGRCPSPSRCGSLAARVSEPPALLACCRSSPPSLSSPSAEPTCTWRVSSSLSPSFMVGFRQSGRGGAPLRSARLLRTGTTGPPFEVALPMVGDTRRTAHACSPNPCQTARMSGCVDQSV